MSDIKYPIIDYAKIDHTHTEFDEELIIKDGVNKFYKQYLKWVIPVDNDYSITPLLNNTRVIILRNNIKIDEFLISDVITYTLQQGDKVISNKPIAIYAVNEARPAVNIDWLGNKFVTKIDRYDLIFYIYSPFKDCSIKIYTTDGEISDEYTAQKDNLLVTTTYTDYKTYVVESSAPIAIFKQSTAANDTCYLMPVNTEWFIKHGGAIKLVGYTDTKVTIFNTLGEVLKFNLIDSNNYSISYSDGSSNFSGVGCRIVADKPIFVFNQADGDGFEQTPGKTVYSLEQFYVLPRDSEFIAFVGYKDFEVFLELPDGSKYQKSTGLKSEANGVYAVRVHKDDFGLDSLPTGTKVITTTPTWGMFEDLVSNNETILFGLRLIEENSIQQENFVNQSNGWARIDSDGTILAQYNISVVNKLDTGTYELNFAQAMNNSNYSVTATCNGDGLCSVCITDILADKFTVKIYDSNNQLIDMPFSVQIFGGI